VDRDESGSHSGEEQGQSETTGKGLKNKLSVTHISGV